MVGIGNPGLMGAFRTALTQLTGRSSGDSHQALLQALGMDQRNAALQGAFHDYNRGNLAGYQKNMIEAFTGVDPGRIGAGMCQPHHMPGPSNFGPGAAFERVDLKHMNKGSLMSKLGGFALGGPLGAIIGNNLSKRSKAKCMERRLNRDPIFRAQFESAVGGRYVPDGRNDGKITIARSNFGLPGLNPGIFQGLGGNLIAGSALSGIARHMLNINNLMGQLGGPGIGGLGGFGGGTVGGFGSLMAGPYGNAYGGGGVGNFGSAVNNGNNPGYTGGPRGGSEMAKLGPGATFEDRVAAFMIDQCVKMQKEIEDKMAELEASNNSGGQSAGGRRGYGGALGGIGQLAGGALGGMVGGPIGSAIGSQLGGALGGAAGGGGGQGQAAGDSTGNSRQIQFEKLKNLMNVMQQMIQSMSNVLNTMHQGAMNSIRNIRA